MVQGRGLPGIYLILACVGLLLLATLLALRLPAFRRLVARWAWWRTHWLVDTRVVADDTSGPDGASNAGASAKNLAALTRAAVFRLGDRRRGGVKYLTGPPELDEFIKTLTEAVKELPQGKIIGPFVALGRWLIPAQVVKVSMRLVPEQPGRGVGLAMTLTGTGGHPPAAVTLWAQEFAPHGELGRRSA